MLRSYLHICFLYLWDPFVLCICVFISACPPFFPLIFFSDLIFIIFVTNFHVLYELFLCFSNNKTQNVSILKRKMIHFGSSCVTSSLIKLELLILQVLITVVKRNWLTGMTCVNLKVNKCVDGMYCWNHRQCPLVTKLQICSPPPSGGNHLWLVIHMARSKYN